MSYLKRFWNNIKNSFYNPEFYSQLRNKRFWRAILVLLGISMVSMLTICIMLVAAAGSFIMSFSSDDFVGTYYPEGLELTAKDNRFYSNVEEPYVIPLPQDDKEGDEEYANAFVIDTSDNLTLDQIEAYDAFVVVTKNGIAGTEESGRMRVISLEQADLGDFVVNEENATTWANKGLSFAKMAAIPLLLFLFVFGSVFMTMWHMFVLLFAALLVKIIAAIKKIEMTYPNAYVVALFSTIPVLILNMLFNTFADIPTLIDILLFVIIVSINLKSTHETHKNTTSDVSTHVPEAAPVVTNTN